MPSWQIYAAGDYYQAVDVAPPELKALTHSATGKSFRRIGRFIQLALIGAARCAQQPLPAATGVYLASGRGDLELTLEIMTQLYQQAQTPKPLNFVNAVSNAACFYLAQQLQLKSLSNFVCNRHFAFESAVQLASLDLSLARTDSALVGSVDMVTAPLSEHRQRLQLAADTRVAEGSHWLWLGAANPQRPRLGQLSSARHFVNRTELLTWIEQSLAVEQCALSAGQFMTPQAITEIQAACGIQQQFEYRSARGYYDSHSGAVASAFLNSDSNASSLLHINADAEQRYSIMLIRR